MTTTEVGTSTAVVRREAEAPGRSISAFESKSKFEDARGMAIALSKSAFVPKEYQGDQGVANCMVAMELAARTGASVLMVMQNLDVINGKPSWRSQFLIASVNSCGRFTPLRYEFEGEEKTDGWRCRAIASEAATGLILEGEWISWEMAKAEGWIERKGSKWRTMPGQMMRYRAAAFWTRIYAPEIALGMYTADEVVDSGMAGGRTNGAEALQEALAEVVEADIVEEGAPPPSEDDDSAPSAAQLTQLAELREKAREAGVIDSGDEEELGGAIERKDGPLVRQWIRVLNKLLLNAASGQGSLLDEEG